MVQYVSTLEKNMCQHQIAGEWNVNCWKNRARKVGESRECGL